MFSLLILALISMTVIVAESKPSGGSLSIQDVYSRVTVLEQEVQELRNENKKLQDRIPKERQQAAFTAFNAYDQGRVYQAGAIVDFQIAHTNIGGAYDPTLSTFTCPITGTYLFGISFFNINDYMMEACLQVAGSCTAGVHCNDQGWNSCSTTEVVDCTVGTQVKVQVVTNNNAIAEVWSGINVATFTGVLIEADL